MKLKDFLVPAVISVILTALSGLVRGSPLRFLKLPPGIPMQDVNYTPLFPFSIRPLSLLVDLAFWFFLAFGVWRLFKFWSKVVLVSVLVPVVVSGIFVFWQYTLYQKLSETDMSCGGDWSYTVKCPLGSYCRSLGQGPLAGGVCKPWLSAVFEIF